MRRPSSRTTLAALLALLVALLTPLAGWAKGGAGERSPDLRMSAMGRLAMARAKAAVAAAQGLHHIAGASGEGCDNEPDCEGEDEEDSAAGGQAETSIAVDATGQHVVVGFNDTRGFALNPVSASGYMVSDDGGLTFVDGGQLPVTVPLTPIGTTNLPQVVGDPDVKYLGGCNFVYSSIVVVRYTTSPNRTAQTMGIHRSTDCGHTWTGPYEVTPVTNPHGLVTATSARDSADKEFIDVDPETGRVMMSWTNFTSTVFAPGGAEMSVTYSDDVLTATPPTWSPRAVIGNTASDGQASVPRFAGNGSPNVYAVWRRFPFPGTLGGLGNSVAFARSADNGATWSAPVDLAAEFFTMDQVLGNDRINTSPSLAVDNSGGPRAGAIYVVYANNDNHDGADVVFQKSADGGASFSAPVRLNSRPGSDRAQWIPWVTVDSATGRVWVFYYDQGIAASGDLSETTVTFSDDGGAHWSPPVPLTDRPFHAGWGNDTGQPNLGDYNQAVAQNGELFAEFAVAFRPELGFADGQPGSGSMNTPDAFFRRVPQGGHGDHEDHADHAVADKGHDGEDDGGAAHPASRAINTIPVSLAAVTASDGGNGFVDPGETIRVRVTLTNYDLNPLSSRRVLGTTARLSTTTPGVSVTDDQSPFPNLSPGASSTSRQDFILHTSPSFVPGTPIELVLTVRSNEHGAATLLHTLWTGTPVATTLLAENFDSAAPGTLPAGWTTSHAGGANTVPWTTSSTFCATTSNGAFHQNAADGVGGTGSPTRFERLFSPSFAVPANAEYVTLDFDVCYDTEDDPSFNILAYDGFLLRVTDLTPGRLLRSELVESFEDEFTTGAAGHFPKHFPRSNNSNYFQDMSAWAGDSQGIKHVHIRLPGMQGSTAQLRWEYTQDGADTCANVRPGHTCGVFIDNLVVQSVSSAP